MSIERQYTIKSTPEDCVCAKFGCGKHLTLVEQLTGKYFAGHSGEEHALVNKCKQDDLRKAMHRIIHSRL